MNLIRSTPKQQSTIKITNISHPHLIIMTNKKKHPHLTEERTDNGNKPCFLLCCTHQLLLLLATVTTISPTIYSS